MMNTISFQAEQLLFSLVIISLIVPAMIYFGKRNFQKLEISTGFNGINFLTGIIGTLLTIITIINLETKTDNNSFYVTEDLFTDTINIVRTAFPVKKTKPPELIEKRLIQKEIIKIKLEDKLINESKNVLEIFDPEPAGIVNVNNKPPKPAIDIRKEEEPEFLLIAEQMPRFPGCETLDISEDELKKCSEAQLMRFLNEHLKYPRVASENKIEGMVILRFIVSETGNVENIKVLKDIGGGCGEAAKRVVKMMNEMPEKWTPGKQRGRPVNVMFTLPVKFNLN